MTKFPFLSIHPHFSLSPSSLHTGAKPSLNRIAILYWQGITHDLSKFSLTEIEGALKYWNNSKSSLAYEKELNGYSATFLHHRGRNPHHYEYWIDYGVKAEEGLKGMRMPVKYVLEMFIDRMCASMNYQKEKYTDKSPLEYYEARKQYYLLHDETRRELEFLLNMLAEEGEEKTIKYIKNEIVRNGCNKIYTRD